jgi:hypothetical protein
VGHKSETAYYSAAAHKEIPVSNGDAQLCRLLQVSMILFGIGELEIEPSSLTHDLQMERAAFWFVSRRKDFPW